MALAELAETGLAIGRHRREPRRASGRVPGDGRSSDPALRRLHQHLPAHPDRRARRRRLRDAYGCLHVRQYPRHLPSALPVRRSSSRSSSPALSPLFGEIAGFSSPTPSCTMASPAGFARHTSPSPAWRPTSPACRWPSPSGQRSVRSASLRRCSTTSGSTSTRRSAFRASSGASIVYAVLSVPPHDPADDPGDRGAAHGVARGGLEPRRRAPSVLAVSSVSRSSPRPCSG